MSRAVGSICGFEAQIKVESRMILMMGPARIFRLTWAAIAVTSISFAAALLGKEWNGYLGNASLIGNLFNAGTSMWLSTHWMRSRHFYITSIPINITGLS